MEFLRDGSVHAGMFIYSIACIGIAVVCYLLAKDKNRNTVVATLAGLIPGINYLVLAYYIGVSKSDRH